MSLARLSDAYSRRGLFSLIGGVSSLVGYAILLANVSSGVAYFACFLVAAGLYVVVGLPLAWLPNNSPRYGKRTTATGMQLTIGNCAGIMSSFIYRTEDKPRYTRGHGVTFAMVAFACVVFAAMVCLIYPILCVHF
jgi:hypothetical protein